VRNRSGQDPLNFPIKLNNQIGALGRKMMGGYGAPPAQFYTIYDQLHARLVQAGQAYERTTAEGFGAINPALVKAGLKPLSDLELVQAGDSDRDEGNEEDAENEDDN
jgi:hypothetical protein